MLFQTDVSIDFPLQVMATDLTFIPSLKERIFERKRLIK